MEAALAQVYPGTRLTDLWRPGTTLTWRMLINYVRWLPRESPVWAVMGRASLSIEAEAIIDLWELWAEDRHGLRPGAHYQPPSARKAAPPAATTAQASWAAKLAAQRERSAARFDRQRKAAPSTQ